MMQLRNVAGRAFGFALARLNGLAKRLPDSRASTRLVTLLQFVRYHGRLPRNQGGTFLDYLFRMKSSGELRSLPRQIVSDKEYGKLFINSVLEGEFTVPTSLVLRSTTEVCDGVFPEDCAIKPTHASQWAIVRRDGEPLNLESLREWFNLDYYQMLREENYQYLEKKIIVEPIVFGGGDFFELNVHCYKGRVKIILVKCDGGRSRERRDRNWRAVDISTQKPPPSLPTEKPECWERMVWAAETLATRFEYIRVDFYCDGKEFFVGELTNLPLNMNMRFHRKGDEERFSEIIFREQTESSGPP